VDALEAAAAFVGAAAENATGTDAASALWVSFAAVAESGSAAEVVEALAVFVGALSEASNGVSRADAFMVATMAMVEAVTGSATETAGRTLPVGQSVAGNAVAASTLVVVFKSVIAEVGIPDDHLVATFEAVATAREIVVGLDSLSAHMRAVVSMAAPAIAADGSNATELTHAALGEVAALLDLATGLRAPGGLLFEVVSASDAGIASLTQLALAAEAADAIEAFLANAHLGVDVVEVMLALDILHAHKWAIDLRFVTPGVGRIFSVHRDAMKTVAIAPRAFDVVETAPDVIPH